MNLEIASVVVPLMDVVARWVLFSKDTRFDIRTELKFLGMSDEEMAAVTALLDALDKTEA